MAPSTSNSVAVYNIVGETEQPASRQCFIRSDDRGLWNDCKSWYIFLIHIGLAIGIMVLVIQIDGRHFKIGSGSTVFTFHSRLYQAQVTGLLSLALVSLRLVAGTGSALLAWRIIFILSREARCNACRANPSPQPTCPIIPAVKTETLLRWSLWATAVIILMWPRSFAAPLASSSLSWIPGITLLDIATPALIGEIGPHTDWPAILYDDTNRPLGQITFQLPGVEPFDGPLPPDSSISERDRCRTTTKQFGKLPAFGQHQVQIINGDKEIVYYDCYIDCEVVSSDTTSQSYATCSVTRNDGAFGNDWLASLALDFTSESLEYTFLQNFSQPWISPNSDAYVAGMLTLGYHASWTILVFGASMTTKTKTILFIALGPGGFAMLSVSVVRIKNFLGCDGKRAR
ncbi:hypothetical protein DER44DRAFT_814699 [Fusarium oxysporum]|nr:hypothetical protein DER44DRAFT_814699 [Fusarium oxysporum]